ncbi:MAG: LysM peptidoglycan-binding domain-containing protein [Pseudomonadota bacterium]
MAKIGKIYSTTLSIILIFVCSACALTHGANSDYAATHYSSAQNLWRSTADALQITSQTPINRRVQAQINWYMRHKQYLVNASNNAVPYFYYVYHEIKRRHLPIDLVLLPVVESLYDPFAYSKVGASGIWQLMPSTALGYGIKINWWYDGRRDIIASTNAALNYLSYLHRFFKGDWLLAIAAYNSGEGRIQAAVKKNIRLHKSTSFWALSLPDETRTYVIELLAVGRILSQPNKYHVNLTPIPNSPYFQQVDMSSPIDLPYAANIAGMRLTELLRLNPGYNQWSTGSASRPLLIPVNQVGTFKRNLSKAPKAKTLSWIRYEVEYGDSLNKLANKFNTTDVIVEQVNQLSNNKLHRGQILLIPINSAGINNLSIVEQQREFNALRSTPIINVIEHEVQGGETLSSIARHYGVSVAQLRFWNQLKVNARLQPGMKISIWLKGNTHPRTHIIHYTVKKGDSLFAIAARHNSTVKAIKQYNHLKTDTIVPGMTLKIPSNETTTRIEYTVKKGDTLSAIAKRYGVSVKSIQTTNDLDNIHQLSIGQQLLIYVKDK